MTIFDNDDFFPMLPNSFLGDGKLHPSMSTYLDDPLLSNGVTKRESIRFVTEHILYLRAILPLLWERDQVSNHAYAANMLRNDPTNLFKNGPLNKFTHTFVGRPTWKVKYAEVRRGGDGASGGVNGDECVSL